MIGHRIAWQERHQRWQLCHSQAASL